MRFVGANDHPNPDSPEILRTALGARHGGPTI